MPAKDSSINSEKTRVKRTYEKRFFGVSKIRQTMPRIPPIRMTIIAGISP
jgi:hypothetical protein